MSTKPIYFERVESSTFLPVEHPEDEEGEDIDHRYRTHISFNIPQ